MSNAPTWFPAVSGEAPHIVDAHGYVASYVYLADAGETAADAIASAMRAASNDRCVYSVFDCDQTFLGTAYGF
jgi:hypothetical protein